MQGEVAWFLPDLVEPENAITPGCFAWEGGVQKIRLFALPDLGDYFGGLPCVGKVTYLS